MPRESQDQDTMPKTLLHRLLLAASAAALLSGCGSSPTGTLPVEGDGTGIVAPARLTVSLGKVGVLSKASAINLKRLVLTAVSGATPADTVRDTLALSGSDAVTVQRIVKLKPLLSWTLKARTLDQKDSVIHLGETPAFSVKLGDTAEVKLTLASRFSMYQAVFSNLPNSLGSGQAGTEKMGINLNKLVLKIDGQVKKDTTLASGYFLGGQTVTLNFDYVTPGAHTVTMEAHGAMVGYSGPMFAGSGSFSTATGEDGSQPVTLNWVGPTTGAEKITLILGRIGKVVVTGGFNSNL
jgi:hypothetical protein